ncbi:hypothetical protein GYB22_01790 [bacterium]|nr:hypothetical protein [bacterium]
MLRKLAYMFIVVLFNIHSFGQWKPETGLNFLKNTNAISLTLDAGLNDDFKVFAINAVNFKNLQYLTLYQPPADLDYNFLKDLPKLKSLIIYEADQIPVRKVIHALHKHNKIKCLRLSGIDLKSIPSNIKSLKNLKTLELSHIEKSRQMMNRISKLDYLDTLCLPKMSVTFDNLRFNKFERLDFLELNVWEDINNMTYIPISCKVNTFKLNSSDQLGVNTELGEHPLFNLSIPFYPKEHLLCDWNVYNDFYGNHSGWFMMIEPYSEEEIDSSLLADASVLSKLYGNSRKHGTFTRSSQSFKAWSDAYLFYDKFMQNYSKFPRNNVLGLDTTPIRDRYQSLDYSAELLLKYPASMHIKTKRLSHRLKHKKLIKEEQHLLPFRKVRRIGSDIELAFDLRSYEDMSRCVRLLPELGLINQRHWIMQRSDADRLLEGDYYDFRMLYDSVEDKISFEVKSLKGFEQFPIAFVSRDTSESGINNEVLFRRYSKRLERRLMLAEKKLARQVRKLKSYSEDAWSNFRSYLSEDEKALTQSEWLMYKEKVQENEKSAIENAALSWPLLWRYLEIEGFKELDPYHWRRHYNSITTINHAFERRNDSARLVNQIHLIDIEKKTAVTFNGVMWPDNLYHPHPVRSNYNWARYQNTFWMPHAPSENIKIVLELSNGDLSFIPVIKNYPESKLGIDYPQGISEVDMLVRKIFLKNSVTF